MILPPHPVGYDGDHRVAAYALALRSPPVPPGLGFLHPE